MRESLCELGDWVCCSQLFGPIHIYSGFSSFLHYSLLSALGNPGRFHVSTGQWFEDVPELLDL